MNIRLQQILHLLDSFSRRAICTKYQVDDMAALIERHSPVCLVETCGANRRRVIDLFRSLGYAGWVLQKGNLVSVMEASSEKDIVFLPAQRCV